MKEETESQRIVWNDDEWFAIAEKAKDLKEKRPELPWNTIVLLSQDGIAVERRRHEFHRKMSFKPLFDLLKLDEHGNVPPPAPPPEPPITSAPIEILAGGGYPVIVPKREDPLPAFATAPIPEPSAQVVATVKEAPLMLLVGELFDRLSGIRSVLDQAIAVRQAVWNEMDLRTEAYLKGQKRVDAVEAMMTDSMETIDAASRRLEEREKKIDNLETQFEFVMRELAKSNSTTFSAMFEKLRTDPSLLNRSNGNHATAAPKTKFLLIGPQAKDLEHIRQKLSPDISAELSQVPNTTQQNFPASMHYCLISGHHDFTRIFQACRAFYGEGKVVRVENGNDGTFARHVERLCRERIAQL